MSACPDPGLWVSWTEGRLGADERARWIPHLDACPDCARELASLASAAPEAVPAPVLLRWRGLASRRRLRYAWAAGLLLPLAALWLWKEGEKPRVSGARAPGPVAALPACTEWPLGPTAQAALASGSRGGVEGPGRFRLDEGRAWVESWGEPVRVALSGFEGELELSDGALALWASPVRLSGLLREARAGAGDWGVTVVRGKVKAGGRVLGAGESLGSRTEQTDFRGWKPLRASGGILLESAPAAGFVAEILVRKRKPPVEAFLLFRDGKRGWQVPLGVYLPVSGAWVRLRLEVRPGEVRLSAGGQEYFRCVPDALGEKAYAWTGQGALGLQAVGGDLEVGEARWR